MMTRLTEFNGLPVKYLESSSVVAGVECDVYEFSDDPSCDLGIVTIAAGAKTPRQRVVRGEKTIEACVSGAGILQVTFASGEDREYQFSSTTEPVIVRVGETMQWRAETAMVISEICYPPYAEGRFENLD